MSLPEAADNRWRHATCVVWWATPIHAPDLIGFLDDTERRSAARLARTADRVRYVTAHALVRLLLADRTGEPAAQLRFDRTCRRCGGDHGKPRLAQARPGGRVAVSFNLAYAGDRIVVAVADGDHDAGVDVERVPGPHAGVLGTADAGVLTARERSALQQLPSAGRCHALAVWWTRKEAVLKASGDGLAVPPSTVEVTPPDAAPAVTGWVVTDLRHRASVVTSRGPAAWHRPPMALHDLDAGPGYVGCVAVCGAHTVDVIERDAGTLLGVA